MGEALPRPPWCGASRAEPLQGPATLGALLAAAPAAGPAPLMNVSVPTQPLRAAPSPGAAAAPLAALGAAAPAAMADGDGDGDGNDDVICTDLDGAAILRPPPSSRPAAGPGPPTGGPSGPGRPAAAAAAPCPAPRALGAATPQFLARFCSAWLYTTMASAGACVCPLVPPPKHTAPCGRRRPPPPPFPRASHALPHRTALPLVPNQQPSPWPMSAPPPAPAPAPVPWQACTCWSGTGGTWRPPACCAGCCRGAATPRAAASGGCGCPSTWRTSGGRRRRCR